MSRIPEDLRPESWHRFFAIENNNRAWELAGQSSRSSAEQDEMFDAAHAAAWHWSKVGTELNLYRARMLVAEVHALRGFGESALSLAGEVREYFLARETPDWEIAFVHSIHAHAAAVAGRSDLHRDSYAAAKQAVQEVADDEDRRIVLLTFEQVPVPPAN